MKKAELVEKIRELLKCPPEGHGLGILTTCGPGPTAHAAWMGTIACPSLKQILTMTSPDSEKIQNILENPRVEWLFANEQKEELLYLKGRARIIQEPEEVEKDWKALPDKSRAYFMDYQTVGMKFLIIETTVEQFEYRVPKKSLAFKLGVTDLPEQ